jgi:hypothetical protein
LIWKNARYRKTTRTISVNGHTILYSESKNKDKRHVLFIHGLGAASFGWRDIPDALSAQFHTIALDLIGFGGSDKPQDADYTIKGFSKFIMDFLRAIELEDEKITAIIGHSLGCYIDNHRIAFKICCILKLFSYYYLELLDNLLFSSYPSDCTNNISYTIRSFS